MYVIGRGRYAREVYPEAKSPPKTVPTSTVVPGNVRQLQNGVPLPLLRVDVSQIPDHTFAARLQFAAECSDGTDAQIRQGDCNSAVSFKPPATFATSQAQNATNAFTVGNLTITFTWTTVGTVATLNVTVTSTLALPTSFSLNFNVIFATHPQFTIL